MKFPRSFKLRTIYPSLQTRGSVGHAIDALAHTCDKEVSYVDYHYELSIKKNAAKKRHVEFIDSISKANRQIHLDIFAVFAMIEEVKESKK